MEISEMRLKREHINDVERLMYDSVIIPQSVSLSTDGPMGSDMNIHITMPFGPIAGLNDVTTGEIAADFQDFNTSIEVEIKNMVVQRVWFESYTEDYELSEVEIEVRASTRIPMQFEADSTEITIQWKLIDVTEHHYVFQALQQPTPRIDFQGVRPYQVPHHETLFHVYEEDIELWEHFITQIEIDDVLDEEFEDIEHEVLDYVIAALRNQLVEGPPLVEFDEPEIHVPKRWFEA